MVGSRSLHRDKKGDPMGCFTMKTWMRVLIGGLMAFLGVLLIGPFLVPVPALENTVHPQELGNSSSRFLEVNGLVVHYQRRGAGSPVMVLLHGFGASTFSWREVMDPLSAHGTVVAFDRPAFGLTERPLSWEGENPYRPQAQVRLTLDLVDRLGLGDERIILVGNSAGGTIAMAAAMDYPDRVDGLVLVDPAVYGGGGSPGWIRPLLHTPQMDRLGPWLVRTIADRGETLIRESFHDPSLVTGEVLEGYRRPLRVRHWDRALWELTKASRPWHLDQRAGQLSVPTMVITGDDDRIVPTSESIRLAGEIPGADLAILQDCGHLPQEECPEQFLVAVEDFLGRLGEE